MSPSLDQARVDIGGRGRGAPSLGPEVAQLDRGKPQPLARARSGAVSSIARIALPGPLKPVTPALGTTTRDHRDIAPCHAKASLVSREDFWPTGAVQSPCETGTPPGRTWSVIQEHDYTVNVTGTGPKTGTIGSPEDELPDLEVASPPEFGGPGRAWSPEHLFVASVATCLMTTFRAIAAASNLEVVDYSDDASGKLVFDRDRLYRIESITLKPHVVVSDRTMVEKAKHLLEKAERACLISRSVNSRVAMEATVQSTEELVGVTVSAGMT